MTKFSPLIAQIFAKPNRVINCEMNTIQRSPCKSISATNTHTEVSEYLCNISPISI